MTATERVTLFAGHYGSGKTNVAVNYAVALSRSGPTAIADLDIVNPYFRTKDAEKVLKENGIRLIASDYAESNVDLPALPADAYSLIDDRSVKAVIDVGGDDRGALALGRYAPGIKAENNYRMLLVVNMYRPLTSTPEDCAAIMREIRQAAGIDFTGIVNNSNLGEETTADDVLRSAGFAEKLSGLTGLPVVMTAVEKSVAPRLEGRIENIFPIEVYVRQGIDR
ncbi:MAG: hypothetical protein K6G71_05910 [Clostridiales bacterium]|nr:hypothetical protein [Clostridiales bacterium]